MFRELMKKLGIQTALSTAYHPQTDGTTEHFNQEICKGTPLIFQNLFRRAAIARLTFRY
jgi:hypothetical protein